MLCCGDKRDGGFLFNEMEVAALYAFRPIRDVQTSRIVRLSAPLSALPVRLNARYRCLREGVALEDNRAEAQAQPTDQEHEVPPKIRRLVPESVPAQMGPSRGADGAEPRRRCGHGRGGHTPCNAIPSRAATSGPSTDHICWRRQNCDIVRQLNPPYCKGYLPVGASVTAPACHLNIRRRCW